jgi:hypothetical protein
MHGSEIETRNRMSDWTARREARAIGSRCGPSIAAAIALASSQFVAEY